MIWVFRLLTFHFYVTNSNSAALWSSIFNLIRYLELAFPIMISLNESRCFKENHQTKNSKWSCWNNSFATLQTPSELVDHYAISVSQTTDTLKMFLIQCRPILFKCYLPKKIHYLSVLTGATRRMSHENLQCMSILVDLRVLEGLR